MFTDQIEKMKREYTDKYVLVDATRPELARFRDVVGRVKTVNMNGRLLVEFDEYHVNIGWYDIDPEFLKILDQPPPKPAKTEAKKAAPKAAPADKAKPAAKAAPAAGGKLSVAEMLAAAKAGGAAKAGAAPAKAKSDASPAAGKPGAPKVDRAKMSVADMLAAARAGGASGAAPAAPAEEAAEESAPAPVAAKKAAPAKSSEKVDKSKMTIDDMVAWCREHDTK